MFFCPQKVEKTKSKSCILMAVGSFFFSAAPTAQNSPELHFRFINSFIQPSLVGSLVTTTRDSKKGTIHAGHNLFFFVCDAHL